MVLQIRLNHLSQGSLRRLHRFQSTNEIRNKFLDYFKENDHKFIRSSPVVPFCDSTVAFVNAGMNQFKSVFLGKTQPPSRRAVNSQKCIRVGGKHNDLSIVGQDSYHHTFFEMLGNWSFGDYFKKEACSMAIDLLKGPYRIDPSRLYVTYFKGDPVLGLEADLETLDIWRSLGFDKNRILPFGSKDNFWEMGATGPCGPCTEIHFDHLPHAAGNRADLVNAGTPYLTEIWNIVFIQYRRNEDGSISHLPEKHVDTGMGLERLSAILQNKSSNYDSDLFLPIFDTISKISKFPGYKGFFPDKHNKHELDVSYRILADHSRMITACLADGMLPDQNQKLRRVLRKALLVSEKVFNKPKLFMEIIPVITDILGPTYPEMVLNLSNILEIMCHEEEVYKRLRATSSHACKEILEKYPALQELDVMECPGFVPAFQELQSQSFSGDIIPGKVLFKLHDTYGLQHETISNISEILNLKPSTKEWEEEIKQAKIRSKGTTIDVGSQNIYTANISSLTKNLRPTDNELKYYYIFDESTRSYISETPQATITGYQSNDDGSFSVITDKSNFYFTSGGQQGDIGIIDFPSGGILKVKFVEQVNNCIVHTGILEDFHDQLKVGDLVTLRVDFKSRTNNTIHHTATHILNGAIKSLFNKVTYQISSSVTPHYLKIELGIFGQKFGEEEIEKIEDLIQKIISFSSPMDTSVVNASDIVHRNDVSLVPGEIYPESGLRLLTMKIDDIGFISRELCCGTHVRNSREIGDFCITNIKQTNRSRYLFTAVAGEVAFELRKTSKLLQQKIERLELQLNQENNTLYAIDEELQKIRNDISHGVVVLPFLEKNMILENVNTILKQIRKVSRTNLKEFIEHEMRNVLQEKNQRDYPFIVHFLRSSALMEEVPLQKATRTCVDRPILVISMTDGLVKARCTVPKNQVNADFTAQKWMQEFAATFRGEVTIPKGQNPNEVCNMKSKKVQSVQFYEQLEAAINKSKEYANKYHKTFSAENDNERLTN